MTGMSAVASTQPPEIDPFRDWPTPVSSAERRAAGRALRDQLPRRTQAELTIANGRDPLGILDEQNRDRLQDLIPLRNERMSQSPFTFYRGTAAIMAADLAASPHSGILVASCGDAHVSNFGFYASRQRTLVFDLNDFDEAAWAPWEWDLKRLITSVVISGQSSRRKDALVRSAAANAVRAYADALRVAVSASPTDRFFSHLDPETDMDKRDASSQRVLRKAMKHARKRTGERAAKKLTEAHDDGRLAFALHPPTMTAIDEQTAARSRAHLGEYLDSAHADVKQLMRHYVLSDVVRRVVGVGSVGTRCYLALLQDGDRHPLILQAKEASRSVLEQYGGIEQPEELRAHIATHGEGGRVVELQRILQSSSDPLLGYMRGDGHDLYVRQFHDMKGGIDTETIDDDAFESYVQACAVMLARAHSQSPIAAMVSGYVGSGKVLGEALVEWGYAYAALSRSDYEAFLAAQ